MLSCRHPIGCSKRQFEAVFVFFHIMQLLCMILIFRCSELNVITYLAYGEICKAKIGIDRGMSSFTL